MGAHESESPHQTGEGLFARGVTLLGGNWINDSRGYVDALLAGESTAPFARKSALEPAQYPGWEALLEKASGTR